MKSRQFNISGPCVPALHYMVDTSAKIDEIVKRYIDKGEYFAINRARQYGKTTTIKMLSKKLEAEYVVINLSFEGVDEYFASLRTLAEGLRRSFSAVLKKSDPELAGVFAVSIDNDFPFSDFRSRIQELCRISEKPVVLIIDEVDKAADNSVFLSLLGMLRDMYIERNSGGEKTFQSVILASVHDIKNLKNKIRPEEQHSYNSPWNIAAAFDIDMSFSVPEIAGMLSEYESDYHTGMDTDAVAERIYYYTSGYPFLVSDLCKVIHDNSLEWSADGVDDAEQRVLKEDNTLFDDVVKNLVNYPTFGELVEDILLKNADIGFEKRNPEINRGVMFGILKEHEGKVSVSNIVFETCIYNYYVSVAEVRTLVGSYVSDNREQFVQNGHLDMSVVLNRFSQFMYSEYRDENSKFIEKHASLLFLCYLKPIINGTGHYVVEPQTRGNRRMDIVVFFGREEHIIELKIWRGEQYEQDGLAQLADYLKSRGRKHGYLLSFCDNVKAPRSGGTLNIDDCEITEVIIAYRDNK